MRTSVGPARPKAWGMHSEERMRIKGKVRVGWLVMFAVVGFLGCGSPVGPGGDEPKVEGPAEPEATDVFPTFVQRLPEMEFVVESTNPTREGWPTPGQQVTWEAHIRKIGGEDGEVGYAWTLDGDTVDTGTVTIQADSTATVDYPWSWTFDRHQLAIVVDPHHALDEVNEANNTVEVFTDALSVGFWVEQGHYDAFREHISETNSAWSSFEDWAQSVISSTNEMFVGASQYPETPDGVLDRVRLDRIVIIPDGTAWHHVGFQADPPQRTEDMVWGFRTAVVHPNNPDNWSFDSSFMDQYLGNTIHELMHTRHLEDVYKWDLIVRPPNQEINIEEGGEPLVGSRYLPILHDVGYVDGTFPQVYETPEKGLMNWPHTYLDRYSAIALNRFAHQRPRYGNYNCPVDCGAYMNDLPEENVLDIQDEDGQPLPGASVEIYQSELQGYAPDDHRPLCKHCWDDKPDIVRTADANGQVTVGANPFGIFYEPGNNTRMPVPNRHIIIRVQKDGRVGYTILESRVFNLAYWAGHTERAHYRVAVELLDPE